MNTVAVLRTPARNLICAVAACLLTVILMGEIGQAPVQAAQRAALLQA